MSVRFRVEYEITIEAPDHSETEIPEGHLTQLEEGLREDVEHWIEVEEGEYQAYVGLAKITKVERINTK